MKKTTLFSAFLICLSLTLGCNGTASDAQPVSPNENVSVKETKQSVVVSQNETESVPVANEVTPVSVNNAISEDLSKYLDRACAKNISKELENPIALFSKAAEGGDMKAQYLLAECYFHGEGADENFEKAVFWYQKSAAQDYFYAQEMLAACYAAGKGIQKNNDKAIKLLEKLANNNFGKAQEKLLELFLEEKKYKEAIVWLEKAAAKNMKDAELIISSLYLMEETGLQDIAEGIKWLEKSAEKGNVTALRVIGGLYFVGKNVPKDFEKACKFLQKAVEDGDRDSSVILFSLAKNYALGVDVPKNKEKACELLEFLYSKSSGLQKEFYKARKFILNGKYDAAYISYQKAAQLFTSNPSAYNDLSSDDFFELLSGSRLMYFWYTVSLADGYSPEAQNFDYICLGDENIEKTSNFFWASVEDFRQNKNKEFNVFGQYLKKIFEVIQKCYAGACKPSMNVFIWDKNKELTDSSSLDGYVSTLSNEYYRSEVTEWSTVIKMYMKIQSDFNLLEKKIQDVIDREKLSENGCFSIEQSLAFAEGIQSLKDWVSQNDKILRFYLFDTPVILFSTITSESVFWAEGIFFSYFNDNDKIKSCAKAFSALTTPVLPYTSENYVRDRWFTAAKKIKTALPENDYKELQNLTTKVLPAINLPENYKFNWP
jgi:TPR repeat protein